MPFYFKHPGGKLDLEDLPLDRWTAIQQATGIEWHQVLTTRLLGDTAVAQAVVKEASAFLGIEPPSLTLRTLMDTLFFEAGETVPAQYNDGMPDPKATASEAATT